MRRDLEERLKALEESVGQLYKKAVDRPAFEELQAKLGAEGLVSFVGARRDYGPRLMEGLAIAELRRRREETPEQTQARHEKMQVERAERNERWGSKHHQEKTAKT